MSLPGTKPTCRPALMMSVSRGRPEVAGRRQAEAFDPNRTLKVAEGKADGLKN
jgi:hypothetical protein